MCVSLLPSYSQNLPDALLMRPSPTVFGLPDDVVAAALGIDPSEVQKISDLVGTTLPLIHDHYPTP